jgi:hypothetical protein
MLFAGTTVIYKVTGERIVHCERCGGDRPFKLRSGRRWVRVLGVPVYPLDATGEHLRCAICRTCYRMELLRVPTVSQMLAALHDGTRAAVLAMLHAGDPASRVARRQAAKVLSAAGAPDDSGLVLAADLAGHGLRHAIEGLAIQLEPRAKEWFLSNVVQVGLADGSLSARERDVVGAVARCLGMSQARADDVIVLAEEASQAG